VKFPSGEKNQAPKLKSQTNPNNPKSNFQTKDPSTIVPNVITSGRPWFALR
jgi:hypothetical protein